MISSKPQRREELAVADEDRREEPVEGNRLGGEVAAQMEAIEADFGEDYRIGNVVTIVEVITSEGAVVRVRNSDGRPWIGRGLLRAADRSLEQLEG
jgi:hypothetical protein